MRRILTQNLVAGMKLAKAIYSSDGLVLLGQGIELNSHYIKRLLDLEILSVYIEDDISQGIECADVINERTRVETVKSVRNIVESYGRGKSFDGRKIKKQVNRIVDELFYAKDVLVNVNDLRSKSDYTFYHMVNVSVLAIMTGVSLGYNELKVRDLGVGALLHDLGKLKIDENIYNKPGKLTNEEYAEIKLHPTYGFEILQGIKDVNILCAHVAFQHHERFDGHGYPRGLKGKEIHDFARIVALADVYDALTADRPYRKALRPYHAVEYLVAMGGEQFDPDLTKTFVEHIAVYPEGCFVELNTNQKAIVTTVNIHHKTRPVVRVLTNYDGQPLGQPFELDLLTAPTYFINGFIEE
jgi:HD-GYP domain-containing protein (c-di-GMP phosphodiesterase class II)